MNDRLTQEGCSGCGQLSWTSAPDGHGGIIVSYICSAEVVFRADGTTRVVKACPEDRIRKEQEQK